MTEAARQHHSFQKKDPAPVYAELPDKLEVCSATSECAETQQADSKTKRSRESTISVLVTCTVLPHLWCVHQQAAQHTWSRLEVLEEVAGGVKLPFSTKATCLPAVP